MMKDSRVDWFVSKWARNGPGDDPKEELLMDLLELVAYLLKKP
jgi:hypothetical protein